MANRATTSFTLVGHSADFTPSVVQLAFWGGRPLQVLAQTRDRGGSPSCSTHWFYWDNALFTTFFLFPRLSATLPG
jgi:hypothetical protein